MAGSAYQSGERLYSEFDHRTKNYSYKSCEVIAKGILLPERAPPEYENRQTLWNAVEQSEKQWNAQLSRGIIMAIPRELSQSEYESLICDYCREQFVSKGMVADFAIHDKGDGNPQAHIMLTMRAFGEDGKFLPKAHKVYDLDEDGQQIKLPSGEWKSHKENTVDWNDRGKAEIWRSAWAEICNRYLERAGAKNVSTFVHMNGRGGRSFRQFTSVRLSHILKRRASPRKSEIIIGRLRHTIPNCRAYGN